MNKEMEEKYLTFARIWGIFNDVRRAGYSDAGWDEFVKEADEIGGNADRFIQDVICCIASEAERQSRMDDLKQRKAAYITSAGAFSKSWELYKLLMECQPGKEFSEKGIDYLAEYLNGFKDKYFPTKLGNTVFQEVCRVKNGKGSTIPEMMTFYCKYADGIDENNKVSAYEEAEVLMNARPEYTLHIMSMLRGLQKNAA